MSKENSSLIPVRLFIIEQRQVKPHPVTPDVELKSIPKKDEYYIDAEGKQWVVFLVINNDIAVRILLIPTDLSELYSAMIQP